MSTPDPTTVPDPIWDWEEAADRGFLGFEVDPTPNSGYALPGEGPNPETDSDARAAARARREALAKRLGGFAEATPAKRTARSSASSTTSSGSE